MDPLLQSGVSLITGAGSGMGQQMAIKFAEHGCTRIFLADVNENGLQETKNLVYAASPNAKVTIGVVDVSNESAVQEMIKACVDTYGRLDFALNNAGIAKGSIRTSDTNIQMLDQIYSVNQKGVFLCEKYEIKQMLTQGPLDVFSDSVSNEERGVRGSIVNTVSLSGSAVLPALSSYTSTKHAVLVSTRVNARQYAPEHIRINSISPGFVLTPMMTSAGLSQEFLDAAKSNSPMNRMTYAAEVAEAAIFLSSSRASGITGVDLPVDSGARLFHYV